MPSKTKPRGLAKYTRKSLTIRPVLMPIGPSLAYAELTKNQWARIDREDAEAVGQFNWRAQWDQTTRGYYAVRSVPRGDRKWQSIQSMHRFLMESSIYSVDHVDPEQTLDNRRCNLRHANNFQQAVNQRLRKTNTSGHRGVSWYKPGGKWVAKLRANGEYHHLGYFSDFEVACRVYADSAHKLHGAFACTEGR